MYRYPVMQSNEGIGFSPLSSGLLHFKYNRNMCNVQINLFQYLHKDNCIIVYTDPGEFINYYTDYLI